MGLLGRRAPAGAGTAAPGGGRVLSDRPDRLRERVRAVGERFLSCTAPCLWDDRDWPAGPAEVHGRHHVVDLRTEPVPVRGLRV